ncbi:hypothetical protein HKX48_005443 [Thoreauomyces humboldtii]|nr:hypothetical protein HKX48_005443 [Thoreauomyces humboldtii]
MPRLPIPTLKNLSEKYLASCKPLLNEEEYERTAAVVEEFVAPEGFGTVLQSRLEAYGEKQKNSWLEDIWLNKAYLEWREPSLINVNWWCQFVDHPSHPKELLRKPPPKGVLTTFQIQRAAGLISNMLNFKDLVDTQRLPAEYMKVKGEQIPLDMNQYKSQFGASRLPGNPDTIRTVWPSQAKHVVVLTKNQIYKVDVLRANGSRVPLKELERLLYAVGEDSLQSTREPAIGILTAGHRDTWNEAHQQLESISEVNKDNLDIINDSLFAVCLDDFSLSKNLDISHRQIFHNNDANNRWFDKAMQLIVGSNGRAGVNGEHTPADAVIPGKIFDHILASEPAVDPSDAEGAGLPAPQKLKWKVNDEIKALMKQAQGTASALIEDTESCLLQTDIYGSRYIKEVAKASPDAYVQLAVQLAWRRYPKLAGEELNGPTAVYESASTRAFLHGRTETGRSMTKDTWAFVESFDNDNVLYDDKRALFRSAIASQGGYMKEATFGRGIDRHMMGLKAMIRSPEETSKATLFTDPANLKSMWFKLSTSNMSPGRYFYGGFGPVVPDGYGINYAIDVDNLKFSISSKKSAPTTSSFTFRDSLERALKDMMILFPKRSEVWGMGWKEDRARESKEKAYLGIMKGLSDEYVAKKEGIQKKYAPAQTKVKTETSEDK